MKGFILILIKLKWKKETSVYQQAAFLSCCSFLLDKFVHPGVGSTGAPALPVACCPCMH